MKKYILAAVFALVASSAVAGEYVNASVGSTSTNAQRSNVLVAAYGTNFDSWNVEGRVAMVEGETINGLGNFVEGRVRYNFSDVVGVKPWVRATLGDQLRTTAGDRAYLGGEAGVGVQCTENLRSDLSIARKVTLGNPVVNQGADQTSFTLGAAYALSEKNSIGASYTHAIGNVGTVSMTGASAVLVSFNHSL
ncbi:MAG TPA: hypothetical protein VFM18_18480 [Methanosarcina sp.]|nr:hypothetical protein [Methanosarcina sp.]